MVNGKAHTLCGNSNRQGTGRRFSHVCTATCDGTSYNRLGKNMDDGSVSMELQGTEGAVEGLERLIRTGNYFIRVKHSAWKPAQFVPMKSVLLFVIDRREFIMAKFLY